MAFSVKAWLDKFGSGGNFDQPTDTGNVPDTPADAAGMRDLETRLSGYTDAREAAEISARNTAISTHTADTTAVHGITDTAALATSTSVASAVAAEATARNTAISAAISAQGDLATQAELDAHVNDTTAAHAATAVSVTPAGSMGSTTVQAALEEAFSELSGGGGGSSAPTIQGTAAGNLGATQTVNFASTATETWLVGMFNASLVVTATNPIGGSRLKVFGLQDSAGNHTLTINSVLVTVSETPSTGLAIVTVDWVDATNFRVESAGVYTESDPNALLKASNLSDLVSASTARTNLGLGTAATQASSAFETAGSAVPKSTVTTAGDLIVASGSAAVTRLAKGADGTVLKMASGSVTWGADTGFANPMTTASDIIIGGASGAPTRLAKGSNNTVLGVDGSGTFGYKADPSGGGGGAAGVHPAAVMGLKTWNIDQWLIDEFVIQNGGVIITGTIVVPYDDTYTGIAGMISTGGAGLTVAYGALWDAAGTTRVAKTASQTSNWTSTGLKRTAFSGAPVSLTAGVYIFGLLSTGTTAVTWRAKLAATDAATNNAGTSDPAYRSAYMFPADDSTTTLTGLTTQNKTAWVGLY